MFRKGIFKVSPQRADEQPASAAITAASSEQ